MDTEKHSMNMNMNSLLLTENEVSHPIKYPSFLRFPLLFRFFCAVLNLCIPLLLSESTRDSRPAPQGTDGLALLHLHFLSPPFLILHHGPDVPIAPTLHRSGLRYPSFTPLSPHTARNRNQRSSSMFMLQLHGLLSTVSLFRHYPLTT